MLTVENAEPRILVLGVNGQVGWELLSTLRGLGRIIPAARGPERMTAAGRSLSLDIADADALRAALQAVQPQLIINAAAYTAVDKAESEPELAFQVNAAAPGVLAEQARLLNAGLIHYSTDYVFDGSGSAAWKESDATNPLSVYGRSKLAGERAIQAAGGAYLILRTSWVYGAHGNNFVKSMLRLGRERTSLSIVCDQIGAPTSARCVAQATAQIVAQARGRIAGMLADDGGLAHLTCAGETSWHGFAEAIFRLAAARGAELAVRDVKPIATHEYPLPARRPANSRLDCHLLRERYAVEPPGWESALATTFPQLYDAWLAESRGPRPPHLLSHQNLERRSSPSAY